MQALTSSLRVLNCSTLEISTTFWHPCCISLITPPHPRRTGSADLRNRGIPGMEEVRGFSTAVCKSCGELGVAFKWNATKGSECPLVSPSERARSLLIGLHCSQAEDPVWESVKRVSALPTSTSAQNPTHPLIKLPSSPGARHAESNGLASEQMLRGQPHWASRKKKKSHIKWIK